MVVRCCRALLVLFCLLLAPPLAAAADAFPFGTTLMLDVAPMRGSKRIPMLEIAENGAASSDLWCASARPSVRCQRLDQHFSRRIAELAMRTRPSGAGCGAFGGTDAGHKLAPSGRRY